MNRALRIALALATVLPASIAAGCGGDDGGGSSGAGSSGGGSAKTLKLGQPATVGYQDAGPGKPRLTAELTPTSINKRPISDLAGIDLEPSQKSSTPYFVKSRCENVSSETIQVDNPLCGLSAVDDRGEEATQLFIIGEFKRCSDDDDPKRLKKGERYGTCRVFLVAEGGGALASLNHQDVIFGSDDAKKFVWKP